MGRGKESSNKQWIFNKCGIHFHLIEENKKNCTFKDHSTWLFQKCYIWGVDDKICSWFLFSKHPGPSLCLCRMSVCCCSRHLSPDNKSSGSAKPPWFTPGSFIVNWRRELANTAVVIYGDDYTMRSLTREQMRRILRGMSLITKRITVQSQILPLYLYLLFIVFQ